MTDYMGPFNNLKNEINEENSKLITFLFFGILIGRIYEKYRKIKKSVFKRLSWINLYKNL